MNEAPALPPAATRRELEVLGLLAEGMQRKQIGRELGITEQTVKNHLVRLYLRWDVFNAAHAVSLAYRTGVLPRPSAN